MVKHTRIDSLVAAGRYDAAIAELAKALRKEPGSVQLRQRLADLLARTGRRHEASGLLVELAEEFASGGFTAKAIATIKQVQRVDRRRPEMAARLAELILVHNREIGITRDGKSERARAELLRNLPSLGPAPLVSELTAEELVALIRELQLESYGPGDAIFCEGDAGDSMYVVASGSAQALVRSRGGLKEVGTLGYGDFFGERALLGAATRAVTVKAVTPLDVLTIDRETLDSLSATYPRIAETLRRFVEQRDGASF